MDILKFLILISIVFFLTIGISVADDFNDTDVTSSQNNGSFSDLNLLIDNCTEYSVINLTHDYFSYDDDNDFYYKCIEINKPLTINGNNHVIDANFNSRIFTISSSDVVLNDIIFINGMDDYGGGAILSGYV